MKSLFFVVLGAALQATATQSAARENVRCTGVLIEVDMKPGADFPMTVIYDDTDASSIHTCVLDVGRAGHWPLRGSCEPGEKCTITGPYFKKIGSTYYMRAWDKAEHVPPYDQVPSGK